MPLLYLICSIIKEDLFKQIKAQYLSVKSDAIDVENTKVKDMEGKDMKVKGKLRIKVGINQDTVVTIDIFVVKRCPFDIILGPNFIELLTINLKSY